MKDLEELREEIDAIDKQMVALFEKRIEAVLQVAEYKSKNSIPILNAEREKQVIEKNIASLKNKKFSNATENFFKAIMSISRDLEAKDMWQDNNVKKKSYVKGLRYEVKENIANEAENSQITVGFQGVSGSFSEEALNNYFGEKVYTYNFNHFEEVFKALKEGKIKYGILPVENSSTGSISEVYDLLHKYGLYIVAEKCIKISQHLVAMQGAKLEDIEEVYSHPQAFEQSSVFFKDYPEWKLIPYYNTAISAKMVSDRKNKNIAAVASERAAQLYDLNVIKRDINYNNSNYTRFIIVGKELEIEKDSDKISIVISMPHKSGALYSILRNFSESNLNMLMIQSRPIEGKPWDYLFYIDFEGNITENRIMDAVEGIEEKSTYFRLLGNYKSDSFIDINIEKRG
ncbi:P-protein [Clostridium pasteurianum DSM 525 = ATCC 6013]|uniref:Bifunctional chorismate mutase/prephenate dehydratase n=1 Tax=Clostridium pasteurianum DSM 525 = ATCC 6013 TaxID=1262449 RepID=A0A0H3J7H0_CLOPA|nr:prephenate dehydratase [Clostridium pasteurianum]AJA49866.1 P-protein [Clostridium pasteurianum DSM 525 = ATCC 6013]AJA53854.1 P-protein [Clostridium pasteurianum DSM 525 = ATCC 6013]AOZ77009.1 bifunctional chorismate mutase/prephenate dehydratase [Clostridium pasteurianum DSM 525 = ATCC 6013]AOZ80806.1 bifunctional chorismate mutase/prephenate dehydratase [Clostridium pasteurianum]ELP57826.1 bifunctional chorismate mutase/ prephenate dehydratase [Clostridium pasteurianum DSM 525 = ATCC 601